MGGLPPGLVEGVRRFNGGAFFEAHEAFEALLDDLEDEAAWQLVLGLVQIAVGYHKATSGHPGAERMLALGLEKLAPLPAVAGGVAVERLRQRVATDLDDLGAGRPLMARLASVPPRIEFRISKP